MKVRLENINMDYVEAQVESILTDLLAGGVAVEAEIEDGFVYLEGMDVGFEEEALIK